MKKNRQKFPPFDDFLDLAENNFHSANLLIFHGISGSGKSSYLHYLTHHHPAFKGKSSHWIWTRHRRFNPCGIQGKDLVVGAPLGIIGTRLEKSRTARFGWEKLCVLRLLP